MRKVEMLMDSVLFAFDLATSETCEYWCPVGDRNQQSRFLTLKGTPCASGGRMVLEKSGGSYAVVDWGETVTKLEAKKG